MILNTGTRFVSQHERRNTIRAVVRKRHKQESGDGGTAGGCRVTPLRNTKTHFFVLFLTTISIFNGNVSKDNGKTRNKNWHVGRLTLVRVEGDEKREPGIGKRELGIGGRDGDVRGRIGGGSLGRDG